MRLIRWAELTRSSSSAPWCQLKAVIGPARPGWFGRLAPPRPKRTYRRRNTPVARPPPPPHLAKRNSIQGANHGFPYSPNDEPSAFYRSILCRLCPECYFIVSCCSRVQSKLGHHPFHTRRPGRGEESTELLLYRVRVRSDQVHAAPAHQQPRLSSDLMREKNDVKSKTFYMFSCVTWRRVITCSQSIDRFCRKKLLRQFRERIDRIGVLDFLFLFLHDERRLQRYVKYSSAYKWTCKLFGLNRNWIVYTGPFLRVKGQ